jgi:hypothetical protein
MFNSGGRLSTDHRREVDLYIEGPHNTFYGMPEFIIRDINGVWVTFGQPTQA